VEAGHERVKVAVAVVVTEAPRQALAYACALWFGAQPSTMVAVTGTNGKTSVAAFTRQIWQELGLEGVNLGTTGVEGAYSAPMSHTTPEPVTLHGLLADMAEAGVSHAAMEASSHGLAQRRLDGVHLVAAAFTNFTQDHLDYHKTFEDYFAAKAPVFRNISTPKQDCFPASWRKTASR
jgi:UDP-N-acetylmuramoyl-L-alanyl-D-glutamate--2,6-diaminopimelate ligase